MARLQKKKVSSDKVRKRESSPEVSTGNAVQPTASTVKSAQRRGDARVTAATVPSEPNLIQKGLQFLREVKVELKKVTWPTRKQAAGSTVVVIILVFILGAFLGLVDISLSKLVQIVLA